MKFFLIGLALALLMQGNAWAAPGKSKKITIGIWRCSPPTFIHATISLTREKGSVFKEIFFKDGGSSKDEMIEKNDHLFFHKDSVQEPSTVIINSKGNYEMWGESGNFATCKAIYQKK